MKHKSRHIGEVTKFRADTAERITAPTAKRMSGGRITRHGRPMDVSPRELERAKDAVGRKAKDRLAWALEFAQQNVDELTPGELLDDRIRLRAFIRPTEVWSAPVLLSSLPAAIDVVIVRREFAGMLQPVSDTVQRGGEIVLMYMMGRDHEGRPTIDIGTGDPVSGATLRFAELLEQYGPEMRRCADPKCRRWFVGRQNKDYCTTTCLSRVTTERLRKGEK